MGDFICKVCFDQSLMMNHHCLSSGTSLKNILDPLVDPDTDEFANLDNWSVIPVKNYHQHKHENCYVEGIKHYNTQNGKFFNGTRWCGILCGR